VEDNLRRWGDLSVCSLRPGLFRDTLPALDEPVALAFVDVDLASSTRDCLTHLWPRLVRGGALFSHDGHLPLVRAVFEDRDLWARLGGPPARIDGLGARRLVRLVKGQT
jgi:O-methyltransferase